MLTRRRDAIAATVRQIDRPIAVLALIGFISQVGISIMLPLLPLYAVELGATPAQLGLMVSAFAVTQTIGQLGSGVAIGRVSARRQLPIGMGGYAISNALIAATTSVPALITFRAISGFGGGLAIIAERLYIARVSARERLAFTNGVVSAASSAGSVLGPAFGGALAAISLRAPFVAVAVTAALATIASLFLPREPDRPPSAAGPAGPDTAPTIAAAEAIDAVEPPPFRRRPGRLQRLRGGWGVQRPLILLALWNLGFSAGYGGWITTYSPLATTRLGIPVVQVALIFAAFGIGAIVLGPWLAGIADRRGRRTMVAVGSILVLAHLVTLLVAAPHAVIFGSAVIAGGGLAAAQSAWFALLGVATDGGRRGRAFGLVTALTNLGIVIGATLAAAAWESFDVTAGMAAAVVCFSLGTASLALVERDRPEPPSARASDPGRAGAPSGA